MTGTVAFAGGYSDAFAYVVSIYKGSDGGATKALYERLDAIGPVGRIATNLFRAQKNSERAKVYRGGGYRGAAYDRKQWSMGNLAQILSEHAAACGIRWGWGDDPETVRFNIVLYIDLPTGQVSFHTETRGAGPDYPGTWDGVPGHSADRIIRWVARLLSERAAA